MPISFKVTDQIKEMSLVVGDTIQGKETYSLGGWHEARLKLLWVGQQEAVWHLHTRTDRKPEWLDQGEAVNWTLNNRNWKIIDEQRTLQD